jgi:hypothetical protein
MAVTARAYISAAFSFGIRAEHDYTRRVTGTALRADALFVGNDPLFISRREQFAILTARYSIPSTYGTREIVEVGGLMKLWS